jgi:hypothetical protein
MMKVQNFWHIGPPTPMKCQKRTTSEFFCQKRPLPWHVPPGPTTARTCRLSQNWHVTCQVTSSPPVTAGGPCRLSQIWHASVAHAANVKTSILPHRIPTLTALIPTLTALIPRRESSRICNLCDDSLHVICNMCCFHQSIRCFEILFHTVNRLQLSRDRMRRPLTSSPFKGQQPRACCTPAHSLIHSPISRTPSPALSSLMSWALEEFSINR